jgi:hypothetical protein
MGAPLRLPFLPLTLPFSHQASAYAILPASARNGAPKSAVSIY